MALNSMIDTGGGHYIAGPGTPRKDSGTPQGCGVRNGQSGGGSGGGVRAVARIRSTCGKPT